MRAGSYHGDSILKLSFWSKKSTRLRVLCVNAYINDIGRGSCDINGHPGTTVWHARGMNAPLLGRLVHYVALFWVRTRNRGGSQAVHEDEHGLFPRGAVDSGVDLRTGFPFGEPGRTGSDRDGRFRREIWNRDEPLLLDRRDSGDGLRRNFHAAVLLRLACAVRAGIFAHAVR